MEGLQPAKSNILIVTIDRLINLFLLNITLFVNLKFII